MSKRFMPGLVVIAAALLNCAGLVSCSESDDIPSGPDNSPTVTIAAGRAEATSVSFTLTPSDAQELAYLVIRSDEKLPDAATVLSTGKSADATKPGTYEQAGLETGIPYTILAAAASGNRLSSLARIEMTPSTHPSATVTAGKKTGSMINFTVAVANADKAAYMVVPAGESVPDAAAILTGGKPVEIGSSRTYTEYGLQLNTDYVVVAACSDASEQSESAPVTLKTANRYYIGDLYQANGKKGVVYLVAEDGLSGQIVSLDEKYRAWSTDDIDTGAIDNEDGPGNVSIIKALPDWEQKYPAFQWCDAMNTGGQSGWYFPALNQLARLFISYNGGTKEGINIDDRDYFNACLVNNGGRPLTFDIYWSSTQWAPGYPFGLIFQNGYGAIGIEGTESKNIRAISEF